MLVKSFTTLASAALTFLLLVAMAQAVPPRGNIKRNSLSVTSPTYRYRPQRPVVSPYLALAPNGVGVVQAINYFSIVQPQLFQQQVNQQQNAALQQLRTDLQTTSSELEEEERGGRRAEVGFQTQRKYFAQPLNHSISGPPAGNR